MFKIQNKFKFLPIVFVVVLLVVLVYFININQQNKGNSGNYSVVYLSTGEVYVGRLSTFPQFKLTNSYILTTTKDTTDSTKSNFQLNPINEALWAPKYLNINRDQVIFYGPILKDSNIGKTLAGLIKN